MFSKFAHVQYTLQAGQITHMYTGPCALVPSIGWIRFWLKELCCRFLQVTSFFDVYWTSSIDVCRTSVYGLFTVKDYRAYSPVHTYTFALLVPSVATSLTAGYRSQPHCERCTTDLTMFPCFSASTFICTIAVPTMVAALQLPATHTHLQQHNFRTQYRF